eukprot:60878_1
MGNSHSKDGPYYGTAAITGAGGGVIGAMAVCAFIFTLPVSLSTVVIGGAAGLVASVATEHFWPSKSYTEAGFKGAIVGFIAGGSTYYMSVKIAPDLVLSKAQLNVISERSLALIATQRLKPSKRTWNKQSPTYLEQYKIKDPKTSYVTTINKQRNAIRIDMKYNPAFNTPKKLDINHTYLEISDGKRTILTELTKNSGARYSTGGVTNNGGREGTLFKSYYANPNKCRTLKQAQKLIKQVNKPWNQNMIYNVGDATCQHYSQDVIHVMTDIPKCQIPLKETNTFKNMKAIDNATGNVFNGNSVARHASKNKTLEKIKGVKRIRRTRSGVSNKAEPSVVGPVIGVAAIMATGVVAHQSIRRRRQNVGERRRRNQI